MGACTCTEEMALGWTCSSQACIDLVVASFFVEGFRLEQGSHGDGKQQALETYPQALDEVGGSTASVHMRGVAQQLGAPGG